MPIFSDLLSKILYVMSMRFRLPYIILQYLLTHSKVAVTGEYCSWREVKQKMNKKSAMIM